MLTQWIDVVDSAVKVGLGAIAGGGFAVAIEQVRQRNDERRRRQELRWTLLVQPIIAFVDDLMAAVGEIYWSHIDGKPPRIGEKMTFFRERQGAVEARIAALGQPVLSELWGPFTRCADANCEPGARRQGRIRGNAGRILDGWTDPALAV